MGRSSASRSGHGLVLAVLALAGCTCESFEPGTLFACEPDGTCPANHVCVAGACEPCTSGGDDACTPCEGDECQPDECANGDRDGDETDIDCGGGTCEPCGEGHCDGDTDCASSDCLDGECQLLASCSDGRQNADETDVDCGGSCARCEPGQGCTLDRDCTSGACSAELCLIEDADDATEWSVSSPDLTLSTDVDDRQQGSGSVALRIAAGSFSYGTGADGNCTVAAGETVDLGRQSCARRALADAPAARVRLRLDAGTTEVPLGAPPWLAAGDLLLFIDLLGTVGSPDGVGEYELRRAVVVGPVAITLDAPLEHTYNGEPEGGAAHLVVMQRVPQYLDVTVEATGVLTTTGFDCAAETGWGVLAFAASGTATIAGSIDMAARGYRGGAGGANANPHRSGDSWARSCAGAIGPGANFGGGGGGDANGDAGHPGGAGGAGHAGAGTGGEDGADSGGEGGGTYGQPELDILFLGSGGGEGGNELNGPPGTGGAGGGIVLVQANALTVSDGGAIHADGAVGGTGFNTSGGGGGGSGGSIRIEALDATLGEGLVTARGGGRGPGGGADGGAGGAGRAAVYSGGAAQGSVDPGAFFAQDLEPLGDEGIATDLAAAVDLSGVLEITLWVKADVPRLPMRLQIGEADSSELQFDFVATGSWQQLTWDLGAIATEARDEIQHLAFVTQASSPPFTFWFDELAANR
jgi:hypothetical protein